MDDNNLNRDVERVLAVLNKEDATGVELTFADQQLLHEMQYIKQTGAFYKDLTFRTAEKREQLKTQLGFKAQAREVKLITYRRAGIAAAVITTILSIWIYTSHYLDTTHHTELVSGSNDIAPGIRGATLTLANGKKIRLADAANGPLAKEAGVTIIKTADGQLRYEVKDSDTDVNRINTLSTAKGETYQVHLPDGSLVCLNASSSLTYSPSLIEQGRRIVKLRGEGYFEIFKDKAHPFIVKTEKQEVEVLGTHFNISSYEEDGVEKTTLIEGRVKMISSGIIKVLKPGQQGKIRAKQIEVVNVDPDLAIAWKNNEFMFEEESVENIMKMVARWYNVEIIYDTDKPTKTISGSVSRFDNVSKVLQIIEATGQVHFKIEGRKIYVLK